MPTRADSRLTALSAAAALALSCLAAPHGAAAQGWEYGRANVPDATPAFEGQTRAPKLDSGVELEVQRLASGLVHPWGIAVLPEGGYLVTERPGRLRMISASGAVSDPIANVPEVHAQGQGGLLDVALAEDFAQSRVIFLTYAKPAEGGSATAAARAVLSEDGTRLDEVRDIFVQTPPSRTSKHYGSRIVPADGVVYITTGEHSSPSERVFAQDLDKSYGKILRLTPQGEVPQGNPFAGREGAVDGIWTLGHRNVQGAALRPGTGELWALEHGPRGGDELNLIEPGANYGWPVVSYGENYSGRPVNRGESSAEGVTEPRYYWDPVIAPGGFAFYEGEMFPAWQGDILAASLNPGGIVRLELEGDRVTGEERFLHGEQRIRDIAVDRDGAVLALVDARDGALLRLTPAAATE